MPMTIERCATCGCSEFSHMFTMRCEPDCAPDCIGDHEPFVQCDCERCDHLTFAEEPYAEYGELARSVLGPDVEVLDGAGVRTGRTLRLDWFDRPVRVVGALVLTEDETVERVEEVPDDADVAVYFAVTADGTEIVVSADEIESG